MGAGNKKAHRAFACNRPTNVGVIEGQQPAVAESPPSHPPLHSEVSSLVLQDSLTASIV